MKNHHPKLTLVSNPASAPTGPLAIAIRDFLKIKRRKCRATTLRTYASVLNQYAAFVGDDHWPPTFNGLLDWFDHLETNPPKMTKTTVYTYWVQLRTFLNFLEKAEILTPQENPVRRVYRLEVAPDDPDLPPAAFPPEDLDKIFRYLEGLTGNGDREAIRNLALLRLAYVTGVRETGLATLALPQLDMAGRSVTILAIHNKNKKDQPVYFDDRVAAAVQAWLDIRPRREGVDQVFVSLRGKVGEAMGSKALYAILQRVCLAAGVDRRKFHSLRHSSALDALDVVISIEKVRRQMGHASVLTTMKYLRGRDEDRARAYREQSLSESLGRRAAARQQAEAAKTAGSDKAA